MEILEALLQYINKFSEILKELFNISCQILYLVITWYFIFHPLQLLDKPSSLITKIVSKWLP